MAEELFEHFRLEVDKGQSPMRIDKYMSSHLEDTSRSRIQQALKEGYVHVGDEVVKANYVVRPGDIIRFVMPYRRRGLEILPQDIDLNIVYEDDDVLLINNSRDAMGFALASLGYSLNTTDVGELTEAYELLADAKAESVTKFVHDFFSFIPKNGQIYAFSPNISISFKYIY